MPLPERPTELRQVPKLDVSPKRVECLVVSFTTAFKLYTFLMEQDGQRTAVTEPPCFREVFFSQLD